ncbi:MAG: type III pantothenate kinase [Saprospiraceae bacterium]|nr:type III pantothenate kinase [Saprospiraceae bacterium]
MFNLVIDVGNTRTKLAFFLKGKLFGQVRVVNNASPRGLQQFIGKKDISGVCVSVVGKRPAKALSWLKANYPLTELTHKTQIPIKNRYKTPKTLGKDRLAVAIAAWGLFPGKPSLIFDAGTCITYDFVNSKGEYLGGGISPGLQTRLKAMDTFTANLPLARFYSQASWLGKTTDQSLRAGAQWGLVHEVDGFIRQYRKAYPGLKVLGTGGDAQYLAKHLKTKIFVLPNLVLQGLNQILIQI